MTPEDMLAEYSRFVNDTGRLKPDEIRIGNTWPDGAACARTKPVDGDWLKADEPTDIMREICRACPVQAKCGLEDMLWAEAKAAEYSDIDNGIFVHADNPGLYHLVRGGLSARQRQLLAMRSTRRRHVLAVCGCGQLFTHLLGADYGKAEDGTGTPSSRGCSNDCIRDDPDGAKVKRQPVDHSELPEGILNRSAKLREV